LSGKQPQLLVVEPSMCGPSSVAGFRDCSRTHAVRIVGRGAQVVKLSLRENANFDLLLPLASRTSFVLKFS